MPNEPCILDQAAGLRRLVSQRGGVASSLPLHLTTVTSGKGGVGKSTIALNIAITLSELGNNVLLVDADANLGNLDVMLGISPRYRLHHVLRDEVDIEDALVAPIPRLKVLAGSSGESDYPLLDTERQNRFLIDLGRTEEMFDHVIIDTAAGLTKEIVNFAIHSSEVIVVTNVEPTAVMDAYAVMKIIWAGNPEIPLSFLMNGVRIPASADEAAEKLQLALFHFLKVKARYVGAVPFDEHVSQAVVQQRPVVSLYPRSAAALSIQSIVHALPFHPVSLGIGRRVLSA
jgi:flagellar biosynthesis protein FlhG